MLSQVNPSGDTREAAERDLDQKQTLARGSTAAFITGGALAIVSTALFIVYRDDIFGRAEAE